MGTEVRVPTTKFAPNAALGTSKAPFARLRQESRINQPRAKVKHQPTEARISPRRTPGTQHWGPTTPAHGGPAPWRGWSCHVSLEGRGPQGSHCPLSCVADHVYSGCKTMRPPSSSPTCPTRPQPRHWPTSAPPAPTRAARPHAARPPPGAVGGSSVPWCGGPFHVSRARRDESRIPPLAASPKKRPHPSHLPPSAPPAPIQGRPARRGPPALWRDRAGHVSRGRRGG